MFELSEFLVERFLFGVLEVDKAVLAVGELLHAVDKEAFVHGVELFVANEALDLEECLVGGCETVVEVFVDSSI